MGGWWAKNERVCDFMKQTKIYLCKLCCAREAEKNNPQGWCSRCETAYIDGQLDDDLYEKAKIKSFPRNGNTE